MLQYSLWILGFVIVAALLQSRLKIPSPVSLIAQAAIFKMSGLLTVDLNSTDFDSLVLMTLPLLIAADALKLHLSELKTHAVSLFTLAVVLVVTSVLTGLLVLLRFDSFGALPVAAIVMLLCMVCATDPVTVSSVFSNFEVPHDLKMLTEGESLFNDATALIIFSIAAYSLTTPETISASTVAVKAISVIAGAVVIGLVAGAIGYLLLRTTKDPVIEAACLILVAYSGYVVAEHFHFSGILAVIVGCLFANHEINKSYSGAESLLDFKAPLLKEAPSNLHNMQIIHKSIDFVALFAAASLFVSIGLIFELELAIKYWKETLVVFGVSTCIRAVSMYAFYKVSNHVKYLTNITSSWVSVLTFAGSKGALSVLMVHMIPASFSWKPMLEQIVIGNIVLSIVVYAPALLVIFKLNSKKL